MQFDQADYRALATIRAVFQRHPGTVEEREYPRFHKNLVFRSDVLGTTLTATVSQGICTFLSGPGGKPEWKHQYPSAAITAALVDEVFFEVRKYCLEDPD